MAKKTKETTLTSEQIEWLRIDRDQTKKQLSDSLQREALFAFDAQTLREENAVYHKIALSNMAKAKKVESFITGIWLEAKELSQGGLESLTLGDYKSCANEIAFEAEMISDDLDSFDNGPVRLSVLAKLNRSCEIAGDNEAFAEDDGDDALDEEDKCQCEGCEAFKNAETCDCCGGPLIGEAEDEPQDPSAVRSDPKNARVKTASSPVPTIAAIQEELQAALDEASAAVAYVACAKVAELGAPEALTQVLNEYATALKERAPASQIRFLETLIAELKVKC